MLADSRFVFVLGIVLGLTISGGAAYTQVALTPVLAVVMMLSIVTVSSSALLEARRMMSPALVGLALNYVAPGVILLGISAFLINDTELRTGLVFLAAVPPAVAVVPFAFLLGGNIRLSLAGSTLAYIAAIGLMPLVSLAFLGAAIFEPLKMMQTLGELIVAPILVSRLLYGTRLMLSIERWRSPVVNWGFSLIIYTIVGLNRDSFLSEPHTMLVLSGIAFAATFVLAEIIYRVAARFRISREDRLSYMLMGTLKNYAFAATVALAFTSARAALPAAVMGTFYVLYFIWLTWRVKFVR